VLHFDLPSYRDGSVYPESYPLDKKERGQAQPHDQNDFDAYMASGLIVTINARIPTKEPTPVAEEVAAGEQINDEKQRSGNSQCRKGGGIKNAIITIPFNVVAGFISGRGSNAAAG
jgi:hypothetical protein